jgi:hypothetical protein
MRALPLKPHLLPKAPLPNTVTLGLWLFGGTHLVNCMYVFENSGTKMGDIFEVTAPFPNNWKHIGFPF